jgi:hypothetical protein
VELAALDDRVIEHVADGAAQRLGAVEHHQDRPGDLQPTLPQPVGCQKSVPEVSGRVISRAMVRRRVLSSRWRY